MKTMVTWDATSDSSFRFRRNYQPTYQYDNQEPISGNYYPVNTRIAIKVRSHTVFCLGLGISEVRKMLSGFPISNDRFDGPIAGWIEYQ